MTCNLCSTFDRQHHLEFGLHNRFLITPETKRKKNRNPRILSGTFDRQDHTEFLFRNQFLASPKTKRNEEKS